MAVGLQETVAEEFDHGRAAVGGHAVEAALGVEQAVGGKDVEVRMEEEVIAEGVLTAAECLRSAYARPLTVAQTDSHLVVAAQVGNLIPFPYLWYISQSDIDHALKELMTPAQ